MAQVELIMPKMGESIIEATILRWVKNVGDRVEADETILEIATDKVDSEVPSPADGVITEIFFKENDVVAIGKVIATIATQGDEVKPTPSVTDKPSMKETSTNGHGAPVRPEPVLAEAAPIAKDSSGGRFYSPLVRTIAQKENIIVTHDDVRGYLNLTKRNRTKEFLYFPIYENFKNGQAMPLVVGTIKQNCLREKVVNYIIYHLTKK